MSAYPFQNRRHAECHIFGMVCVIDIGATTTSPAAFKVSTSEQSPDQPHRPPFECLPAFAVKLNGRPESPKHRPKADRRLSTNLRHWKKLNECLVRSLENVA